MKKLIIAYPYAFAFYYVLNFFSVNPVVLNWETITKASLCFLGLALVAHIIAWLFFKNGRKAALATLYFLMIFLSYVIIEDTFISYLSPVLNENLSRIICAIVIIAFLAYTVRWLNRTTSNLNVMSSFFGVFILVLLTMSFYALLQYTWAVREVNSYSSASEFQHETIDTSQLPDIYHIVLDGYGRSDVLEKYYNLDNSEFIHYLQQNGFTVRDDCQTNYIWTPCSVTSMLTMDYLGESNINANLSKQFLINKLKAQGIGKILQSYGYEYIEVASPVPTTEESNIMGDIETESNIIIQQLLYQTPFRYMNKSNNYITNNTAYDIWRSKLMDSFKVVETIPGKTTAPTYVYCHILMPHPPFVFDSIGNPVNPPYPATTNDASNFLKAGGTIKEYRSGYLQQLLFTNQKVQHVLDTIIAKSKRPALIIVSSDHGPRILINQESIRASQFYEAIPILLAYRTPEDDNISFDNIYSPVNLYRNILNHYCGTHYDLLPDRCYYAPWRYQLRVTEISTHIEED